ncbi:hypothetical protein [Gracilimonas sp. BCB1]|uniref:hypothetical protein n=1 Tax=Gracilimonas sp. BCB1 TaxID=3152362 RepID=UPI0032D98612
MRILISGACGVTSRAIARSIKVSEKYREATIIGTDICENTYGLYEGLYERIWRVPHVRDAKYSDTFIKILEEEKIDRVILIPELEVLYWSNNELPAKLLKTPPKFSEIAISKEKLYKVLGETNLIPMSQIVTAEEIKSDRYLPNLDYPFWMRSVSEGSTSGKGSMLIENPDYLKAWKTINQEADKAMAAEYLPGRNIAVHLLYKQGVLHKVGCYERLEYFKKDVSLSGITGNICKGKLINDETAVEVAKKAIEEICRHTGEAMNGLVAVDLKGSKDNRPLVTEINLRHVAATSSFALGGFNLTEYQLDLMDPDFQGFESEKEKRWPANNQILRDIDGNPIWVDDYTIPDIGHSL